MRFGISKRIFAPKICACKRSCFFVRIVMPLHPENRYCIGTSGKKLYNVSKIQQLTKLFAGGDLMKSTKNCSGTKNTKNCKSKGAGNCSGNKKSCKESSDSESSGDPSGSYTGNPVGWGKYALPVQDADDL